MNIQPHFNPSNQNAINHFFSNSSTQKEQKLPMNPSKIAHYVKMILLSLNIEEERIQPHRNFYEDFDFDILMHINLILLVESYFSIFINDEEAEKITTIQELQDVIQTKLLGY